MSERAPPLCLLCVPRIALLSQRPKTMSRQKNEPASSTVSLPAMPPSQKKTNRSVPAGQKKRIDLFSQCPLVAKRRVLAFVCIAQKKRDYWSRSSGCGDRGWRALQSAVFLFWPGGAGGIFIWDSKAVVDSTAAAAATRLRFAIVTPSAPPLHPRRFAPRIAR